MEHSTTYDVASGKADQANVSECISRCVMMGGAGVVGADCVVKNVATDENALFPLAFTACTRTEYCVFGMRLIRSYPRSEVCKSKDLCAVMMESRYWMITEPLHLGRDHCNAAEVERTRSQRRSLGGSGAIGGVVIRCEFDGNESPQELVATMRIS